MRLSKIASAVPIELDKPRTLILDFNAFDLFSQLTGKELPDVFANLFERDAKGGLVYLDKKRGIPKVKSDFTAGQLRAAIFAGLQHEDPTLTLKHVGRYMSSHNRAALTQAVFMSLMGVETEPADPTQAEAAAVNAKTGAGSASGPSAE